MATQATELVINEIYASVQGESSYAGLPCVFVRLTGCNLRCTYCDSEFAFYDGERRTVESVVDDVRAHNIPLVEITGGEPLLQKACVPLAQQLRDAGLTVLVETSGERPIDVLPEGVIRIMDLKCPSSGECERNNWDNIAQLTATDEVKFVIGDRADYDWMRDVIETHLLTNRCPVLVSTIHGHMAPKTVVEWILADRLPVRFQLQMHKYVWDPSARGV
ncbi:MAG: radical SAM protein [candidate division Zixibacteria bacterium]|nr:radical SAM protein [candidate division Zixibacteria bacterium]